MDIIGQGSLTGQRWKVNKDFSNNAPAAKNDPKPAVKGALTEDINLKNVVKHVEVAQATLASQIWDDLVNEFNESLEAFEAAEQEANNQVMQMVRQTSTVVPFNRAQEELSLTQFAELLQLSRGCTRALAS